MSGTMSMCVHYMPAKGNHRSLAITGAGSPYAVGNID